MSSSLANPFILIAFGGALGAVLRYASGLWLQTLGLTNFPVTLWINILGSCLIGSVYVLLSVKTPINQSLCWLLMTGLLGGFTTYATFSLETGTLLLQSDYTKAIIYWLLTGVLCPAATVLSITATRMLLP